MVNDIQITNFKSIRDLKLDAKRINIFIGEPNTGKSNIIEALSLFSPGTFEFLKQVLRFNTTADLFFDQKVTNQFSVQLGEWKTSLAFKVDNFQGSFWQHGALRSGFTMTHQGLASWSVPNTPVRYYRFNPLLGFKSGPPGALSPPFGENLVSILYSNEVLRQRVGGIFRSKGFRLQLKPTENELLLSKDVNDELYSYPWASVSETLRRVVFFMAILETNRDSTLLLDEPEANTFPFYTKYLAERIAFDETNQFFITTHNPYLLSSVVSKAPSKDVAVFVTYMENFETKAKRMTDEKLSAILDLDSDIFFNLEKLLAA